MTTTDGPHRGDEVPAQAGSCTSGGGDRATDAPATADAPAAHPPSVIEKVRMVLDALGSQSGPIGPSALARNTQLPKSTVFRLCQELADWGVIERVGTAFRLGPRLTPLAMSTSARDRFREVAGPFAVELYATTRMTTNLSVLIGTDALIIEKIHGVRDSCRSVHVGQRAPAHSTAVGRAILAFSPRSTLSSVVSHPLVRTTPFSLASPQLLFKELAAIRQRGLAFSHDEVRLGEGAAAAPLFGAKGQVVGALAVSAKSGELASPDLEHAIRTQAKALSMVLRMAPV